MNEKKETETLSPDKDALQRQLTELNVRSRWYSSQLWHLPFAYLGLTGLAVANAAGESSSHLPLVFWACAVFGVCVLIHMRGIRDGEKRAVRSLQQIEDALHLERTAVDKSKRYVWSLQLAIVLAVLGYLLAGFFV